MTKLSARALVLAALLLGSLPVASAAADGYAATYGVQALWPTPPGAGSFTEFSVSAQNTGSATWSTQAPGLVDLAYHVYDSNGNVVVWDGTRTALSAAVAPGGTATFVARVDVPAQPGTYVVKFALVVEGVEWFASQADAYQLNVAAPSWSAGVTTATTMPSSVDASTSIAAHVNVSNLGNVAWPSNGSPLVDLSYHWYDAAGQNVVVWDGARTRLSASPGFSTGADIAIAPPSVAGTYTLRFAVVNEGVSWVPTFSTALSVTVTKDAAVSISANTGQMMAGGAYDVPISITNTGRATVPAGSAVVTGWLDASGTPIWASHQVVLAQDLAPQASQAVTMPVDAPATPGTYRLVTSLAATGDSWTQLVSVGAGAFTVSYAIGAMPSIPSWAAGQLQSVHLSITNSSSSILRATNIATTAYPVRASYHWYDAAGNVVVWDGLRTDLSADIAPGASGAIDAFVRPPTRLGTYLLVLDLVQDGVAWLGHVGAAPVTATVNVVNGMHASYGVASLPNAVPTGFAAVERFTNDGIAMWPADGLTHCSYHIFDSQGNVVVWDGARGTVPGAQLPNEYQVYGGALIPGAWMDCAFGIALPNLAPGTYTIGWDMVREGQFWFSDLGVPMGRQSFTVVAAATPMPAGPTACPTVTPRASPSPALSASPTAGASPSPSGTPSVTDPTTGGNGGMPAWTPAPSGGTITYQCPGG